MGEAPIGKGCFINLKSEFGSPLDVPFLSISNFLTVILLASNDN